MKLWVALVGVAGVVAAFARPNGATQSYVVFLSGDYNGSLAPCGCSSPMMGGAKRRAFAIRSLGQPGRTVVLENGGFVDNIGRQDELKVETFAEMLPAEGGTAVNLCYSEARLGIGAVSSIARLSGDRLVSLSLQKSDAVSLQPSVVKGPFAISGVSTRADQIALGLGEQAVASDDAVSAFIQQAKEGNLKPLLMLDGNREAAVKLAQKFPDLALIQYKSMGSPPEKIEYVGKTALCTPGDGGKSIVRLVWENGKFSSYLSVLLAPSFKDDDTASRIYKTYLRRVSDEKLLDAVPRTDQGKFVGSATCIKCHAEAGKVWQHSKHAGALATLEHEGHDRDPDCVPCHVVGLSSVNGFKSRLQTPALAFVGCESCHGPGADHSGLPKQFKLPKVGAKTCQPCHRPENSPNFDFKTYWAKIKHK